MQFDDLEPILLELFGDDLMVMSPDGFQVEQGGLRLLVLLSEDRSWLRLLVPLAPAAEAQPFLEPLLAANFDQTQWVRYALHQQVLWGVFHHGLASLVEGDFRQAIAQLLELNRQGLDGLFGDRIEGQIRQIVTAAQAQGQSLESTLQTLERFYAEGMLGGLDQSAQERETTLAAWRYQLTRLWGGDQAGE